MTEIELERLRVRDRLREQGVSIDDDLAVLVRAPKLLQKAAPVLASALPGLKSPQVKEEIVRLLADSGISAAPLIDELKRLRPHIKSDAKVASSIRRLSPTELVQELQRLRSESTGVASLAWAIGDSMRKLAGPSDFSALAEILKDADYGEARQMIPYALARLRSRRHEVVDLLMDVIDDPDVGPQAIDVLGKLNATKAADALRARSTSPDSAIRREARKALKRLEATSAEGTSKRPSKSSRRRAEASTSANFDLAALQAFLEQLTASFPQVTVSDVREVTSRLAIMVDGEEGHFPLARTPDGDLTVQVYVSDEEAIDVAFFGPRSMIEAINRHLEDAS